MAKLGTLTLELILLTVIGCGNTERISRLEKENEELKAQIGKDHSAATYDLQEKCSKDAKEWFSENWPRDKNTIFLRYKNHYNNEKNGCFIVVEYSYNVGSDSSWEHLTSFWNVNENAEYGRFGEHHAYSKGEGLPKNTSYVFENKECETQEQFNQLVEPYMNK